MGIIVNFTARTVESLDYSYPVMTDEDEVTISFVGSRQSGRKILIAVLAPVQRCRRVPKVRRSDKLDTIGCSLHVSL